MEQLPLISSYRRPELKPPLVSDAVLLIVTLILVGFSLVMLYSTTGVVSQEKFGDSLFYVKRQSAAAIAGVVLMFLAMRIKLEHWQRWSPYFLPLSIMFLVLTRIPGIGDSAGGAQRWVNLGIVRFQPGEFVKLLFIIFMAGFFARHEHKIGTFTQGVLKPFLLVSLVSGLFLIQPDFGSSVIIASVSLCMATAAGVRLRYVFVSILAIVIGMGALVIISPYRMARIMSFLSPWADASGKGYQLIQSLIAVGTGQLTGVGLGDSQQKLFFLPAAHTDFIFAVVAEELGFLGAVGLISLFGIFMWRGLRLASRLADDTFFFTLAVGLTMLICVPALLNVAVVTGLVPTKGMVLPLVGYGGSSLIACLFSVGILLALARRFQQNTM